MIRPVLQLGEGLLHRESASIEVVDEGVRLLARDLLDTMVYEGGIGLAAVQVGVLRRLFVVDLGPPLFEPIVFVNPKINRRSSDFVETEEGCLSIPRLRFPVRRHRSVVVEYTDLGGVARQLHASELLSICVQHELDHLDGVLFLDRIRKRHRKGANALLAEEGLEPYFSNRGKTGPTGGGR